MDKLVAMLGAVAFTLILAILLGALAAFPVMWLWNYAAVDVLHMQEINFPHAWALMALCSMLFKTGVSTSSEKKK